MSSVPFCTQRHDTTIQVLQERLQNAKTFNFIVGSTTHMKHPPTRIKSTYRCIRQLILTPSKSHPHTNTAVNYLGSRLGFLAGCRGRSSFGRVEFAGGRRLHQGTNNVEDLEKGSNGNNDNDIDARFIVGTQQGENLGEFIQDLGTRRGIQTHGLIRVFGFHTGIPFNLDKVVVNKGSDIVRVRQNVIKEFKGPVQITQGNKEASKQEGTEPVI